MIKLQPDEPSNHHAGLALPGLAEHELAEQTFMQAREARPNDPAVYLQLANFYNTRGDFEDDRAPERAHQDRAQQPRGALHGGHLLLGQGQLRLSARRTCEKIDYVMDGLESVDKAIEIKSDYMEAIAYKNPAPPVPTSRRTPRSSRRC
ncbi:MAG: hypothetical protein R2712_23295 [Vicinamibacterales bacterium]